MPNNEYTSISSIVSSHTTSISTMNTRLNTCYNTVNNFINGGDIFNIYLDNMNCYRYYYNSITNDRVFYHNESIIIGNNVTICSDMFNGCSMFNRPVIIGNNVNYCGFMFNGCMNFNQSITIPDSVTNCRGMFNCCHNLNQPVIIGNNVNDCVSMFSHCYNFNSNIYCYSNKFTNHSNTYAMFYSCFNNRTKRLFIYNNMNRYFNNTDNSSIIGPSGITWTSMTNGYYNSTYSIFIYTNLQP